MMKMNKKIVLYHCTSRKNLKEILKKGLVPKMPKNITNAVEGIYLSKLPFDWMHYATNETTEAGLMVTVDATGLTLMPDNGIFEPETYLQHPAYVCKETIPVKRFIRVSVSTDKNPCKFREMKQKI